MDTAHPDIDPRFSDFIFLQAQNAGLFLGQIPHPATGQTQVNLPAAESILNALDMLSEKTKGNLNEPETRLLDTARQNIRKLFDKASETADNPQQ